MIAKIGLVLVVCQAGLWAQGQNPPVTCQSSSVTPILRAEGITERAGDIVLRCSGSPGATIPSGVLTIFFNTTVTNRLLNASDRTVDATIRADEQPQVVNGRIGPTGGSLEFTVPILSVPESGRFTLRITNVRLNATRLGVTGTQNATAQLAGVPYASGVLTVGVPARSLLASTIPALVNTQQGSTLPEEITFSNLLSAGTRFSSSRVTEGYGNAFEPGTRFVIRYAGVPAEARLFVQDAIAGSSAQRPTAAGDYGGEPSAGQYVAGSQTLALVRVPFTDPNGVGGGGGGALALNSVSEVQLSGGAGLVVYEVLDASPNRVESAQIPTFIGVARTEAPRSISISRAIYLGPISTTSEPSASAPVPRYIQQPAPTDCTIQRDCDGPYLPRLEVDTPSLLYMATSMADFQIRYVGVNNIGGGLLSWSASISYKNGANWLRLDRVSAAGGATVRVDAIPFGLTPGTYEATITFEAGAAGRVVLPVTLILNAPLVPPVSVQSVTNAATLGAGPLVRGSFGTIKGTNLSGANLAVTFDGLPAKIVFASSEQINFVVPPELGTRTSAQLLVTAAGVRSAAFPVTLAEVQPGIFTPGILNENNGANSAENPAVAGSVVQIFATGLLPPEGGTVEAKLHDQVIVQPLYGGPAPGIAGLQQVNLLVPEFFPTMQTEVLVCGLSGGQRACSPPVRIWVRQR